MTTPSAAQTPRTSQMHLNATHSCLPPICNRAGADGRFQLPDDGWVHLVPRGEFPHTDSKSIQIIDDQAITEILNRFQADATRAQFGGLLVDYDHFSYDTDKPSRAAGWITGLQNRADGIWGQIRWAPDGRDQVEAGAYRFISPVWLPRDIQIIANSTGDQPRRIRPLRLDTAGLTNQPNLRGMVPLSNRQDATAPADPQPQQKANPPMQKLIELLGLSAEATEDDIVAAVAALKEKADAANPEQMAEMTNRITLLSEARADQTLEKLGNRVKPESRDAIRNRLIADHDATLALLEGVAPAETATPVLNRSATKPPAGNPGTENHRARAAAVSEYQLKNRCGFDQAWKAVQNQKPELFE